MRLPKQHPRIATAWLALLALAVLAPSSAFASKLSWLDEVVQEVIVEAKAGGKVAAHGDASALRKAGRLFANEADESLEAVAKRYDDLARVGRRVEPPSEALLSSKFARLLPHDPDAVRTFSNLAPAEKRLVVEMGETAQRLARRYPNQAETMIRQLGTEGLSAVRVYGDDVAEVLVKEGPESLGVLRKTGRGGWKFFNETVLPNKKKLLAAGVLGAFMADPDKFVDYTGRATEFAVREFAKAGVHLATAIGGGASRGLEGAIGQTLAAYGLNTPIFRYVGMAAAGLVVVMAIMVLVGLPVAWVFRPITWPFRKLMGHGHKAHAA